MKIRVGKYTLWPSIFCALVSSCGTLPGSPPRAGEWIVVGDTGCQPNDQYPAKGLTWTGACVDGKQSGKGSYIFSNGKYEGSLINGKKSGIGVYTWTDGTRYQGSFIDGKVSGRGKLVFSNGNIYEGDVVDSAQTGRGVLISNNGKTRSEGYFDNGRLITDPDSIAYLNKAANPGVASIHDCAAAADTKCILFRLNRGDDVNALNDHGLTPIYRAIEWIRNEKRESARSTEAVRTLIAFGADLDYRVNPVSSIANNDPLTPREFLTKSFHKGMVHVEAPSTPNTTALFGDRDLLQQNKTAKTNFIRSREMGISLAEYVEKKNRIDAIRAADNFDGYAEAFLIARNKSDFNAAQQLATSPARKKKLEHLAIVATGDKAKIFDITVKLGNVQGKMSPQDTSSDGKFLFFSFPSKSSSMTFAGTGSLRVRDKSPIGPLKFGYRVYVKHTLKYTLSRSTTVTFIITMTDKSNDIIRKEQNAVYGVRPGSKASAALKLDFGKALTANRAEVMGSMGVSETSIEGDPELITEILKVEPL